MGSEAGGTRTAAPTPGHAIQMSVVSTIIIDSITFRRLKLGERQSRLQRNLELCEEVIAGEAARETRLMFRGQRSLQTQNQTSTECTRCDVRAVGLSRKE